MNPTTTLVVALVVVGAAVGRPRPPLRLARELDHRPGAPGRRPRRAAADDPLAALPELVDLLAVAAAAGLPTATALVAVAARAPRPWRAALGEVAAATGRGRRTVDALADLADAHAGLARPLAAVLRAGLDDGDALVPGLAGLAADTRDLRRRRAEEVARRIPVRLLLPLVTCSLPAAAVLTVVPIVAGALEGLRFPS